MNIAERDSGSPAYRPTFNSCCRRGEVVLPPVKEPPEPLRSLLTSVTDQNAINFRQNIRHYNCALTFTSVNYTADCRLRDNLRFAPFQIQGELYHLQGPLQNSTGQAPVFAQVWFHDPQYGADVRQQRDPKLHLPTLNALTEMLREVNPYISIYQTAKERLEQAAAANEDVTIYLAPHMRLVMEEGADRRRENLPLGSEVAAVIPDIPDYGKVTFRDIRLALRGDSGQSGLIRIDSSHPAYAPLHYVLLFPHGDTGWHWGLELQNLDGNRQRKRLTQRMFYHYHLYRRPGEFCQLQRSGRLFQQYLVDGWACVDQEELNWISGHQNEIRADVYSGLADVLITADAQETYYLDDVLPGHRIILPSSYTGGARFMHKLFQDLMAIVQYFSRPTLFITFTANPRWKEITDELDEGQNAAD